jgi:hypothetical protein
LEERAVSIFEVEEFCPENEGSTFLRNVGKIHHIQKTVCTDVEDFNGSET